MSSRGTTETSVLKHNLEDQLNRLVQQLADLEESKDDFEEEEYEEMRNETIEQLKEMKESLSKMVKGDISLVDSVNAMQLAIQAAISEAFKTPEVIKLFAKKEPGQLRTRLKELDRDYKIGKLSEQSYTQMKLEILTAIQKLGGEISPEEDMFLSKGSGSSLAAFQETDNSISSAKNLIQQNT